METGYQLQGIELRYALAMYLVQHGPTTVRELIDAMEWQGFTIADRASKHVSDALRWERRRGRVRRLSRGLYGPGTFRVQPNAASTSVSSRFARP